VVKINALPDRQFTAEYKEHTGSSDSSTLTWQIILTMPRPADFPAVGGVSGTVTVNLANLPASAGEKRWWCRLKRCLIRIIARAMSPTSGC
jgi:hypothetical protein